MASNPTNSLVIIDPSVSAAGVERFLSGLLGGLLQLPRIDGWDVDLYINASNTAGERVLWPESIAAGRANVIYFPEGADSPALNQLFFSSNKLRGTRKVRRVIGETLRDYGPRKLRELLGNHRAMIERYLLDHPHDVVYFPYPFHLSCPRVQAPTVITPHDFGFWHFERSTRHYLRRMQRDMKDFVESSSMIVVSTEFIAGEVRALFPAAAGKIKVVSAGIPRGERRPGAEDLAASREKFDLPEPYIMNVGWIFEHKNHPVIIKALGELKKRRVPVILLLVGPNSAEVNDPAKSGLSRDVLRVLRTASEEGLEPGRDFRGIGFVDDFDLECLYAQAATLVVSSLYEAGSFPIIEAMAAGCPVVCSDIPPFLDQVEAVAGNAVTFDPHDHMALADALQRIIEEPGEARAMAERAAELVVETYSWEKMALGYLDAFEEAMRIGKKRG
jgi:glycosyltransferase involved in cell wall biosynthesis